MDEDPLRTYRSMRDFRRTAEPRGQRTRTRRRASFVVQKHDATALHYDFRLEVDGVLKSWAVPKGPSFDPKVKRLAMPTEDHPLQYATFEGVIPKGEYGGGPVIVWDRGTYRSLEKGPFRDAVARGRAKVWLEGEKLRGGFTLVRTSIPGRRTPWLLVKLDDEHADAAYDPVRDRPESVLSGRPLEAVGRKVRAGRARASRSRPRVGCPSPRTGAGTRGP